MENIAQELLKMARTIAPDESKTARYGESKELNKAIDQFGDILQDIGKWRRKWERVVNDSMPQGTDDLEKIEEELDYWYNALAD